MPQCMLLGCNSVLASTANSEGFLRVADQQQIEGCILPILAPPFTRA